MSASTTKRFGHFNDGPCAGEAFELDARDVAQRFSVPGHEGEYLLSAVVGQTYELAWRGGGGA